jgi:hypothetical protein
MVFLRLVEKRRFQPQPPRARSKQSFNYAVAANALLASIVLAALRSSCSIQG